MSVVFQIFLQGNEGAKLPGSLVLPLLRQHVSFGVLRLACKMDLDVHCENPKA